MSQVRILPGALRGGRPHYLGTVSSDLIAVVFAGALGIAVVILGWRRRLGPSTDEWLPEYGGDHTEKGPPPPIRFAQTQPSPPQRRMMIGLWMAFGVSWAAFAIFSAHNRLENAVLAAGYLVTGLINWRRWRRRDRDAEAPAQ